MDVEAPKELIDQIAQNKCVVFVGSGLSRGAGLPTWPQLLQQMLNWSEINGVALPDKQELERYIEEDDLLLVAEEMRERLGEGDFQKFMAEVFRNPDIKPTDVHKALTKIGFAAALTSNYDTLLESAYTIGKDGTPPHTFTQLDTPELSSASRSGEFYVLKVHGTIDRIETVVLGKSDYRDVMHDNLAYRQHLKTLFSTSTVLFLGFGLTDPDMLLLLDELKAIYKDYSGKHYALMNDQEVSGIKQKRFEKDYGIKVIAYTPSGPERPEIKLFLTQLAEQVNEAKSSISLVNKPQLPFEIDIEAYTKAIEAKYSILDLDTLTPSQKDDYIRIQLGNVYVEQNVRDNLPPIELPKEVCKKIEGEWGLDKECLLPEGLEPDYIKKATESYYSKTPMPVLGVITAEPNKYLVILGDPGSGKSTLTRYIALSVLGLNHDEKLGKKFAGYLPLLIELREFVGMCFDKKCDKFLDYFHYLGETQGYHLKGDEIDRYLKDNGKALVIFDGLDEIFDPMMWKTVNRMIAGFALDYPKVRIIVTSRPVGYKRNILSDSGFSHVTIQDFETEHITDFLEKWYSIALDNEEKVDERKERIMRSLKESVSIRQLAGNPLLLTILAIIAKHQEIPQERWKLFDHAAGVLVEHWDINRHLKNNRIDVNLIREDDKKELLRRIAFKMQSGPDGLAGNFIHKQVLQQEIEEYLKEQISLAPARAKVIAISIIEQFRTRNFILCLYGADFFGFIHRTFLEYFCADSIVKRFSDQEITIEDLKMDYYGEYWENETWHEVLRLICGIKEKFAEDLIEHLMQVYDPQWFGNRPPWNIVLAIKCLSEIRNPDAIDETAKKLLLRIIRLFEMVRWTQDINKFLYEEIVPAAKLVGNRWPHKNLVVDWFSKTSAYVRIDVGVIRVKDDFEYANSLTEFVCAICSDSDNLYTILLNSLKYGNYAVRKAAIEPLVQGWHDDPKILPNIKKLAIMDVNDGVRAAAVEVLAQGWPDDPETLPWLKKWAVGNEYYVVRWAAVQELVQNWPDDPETLSIIKKLVVEDFDDYISWAAVHALVQNWPDDPETLSIIKKLAVEDVGNDVRWVAVGALVQGWHDDPETLLIVKKLAVEDSHSDVRKVAVEALAQGWPNDPETLFIIKKLAVEDSYSEVRRAAVQVLAQGWPDDPETLFIIKKLAVEDSHSDVRKAAVQALAQGWPNDPETLPWLKKLAEEDVDYYGRITAVEVLAQGWHDDPKTLSIVKKLAVEDVVNIVRVTAVQVLAQGWPDDLEALHIIKKLAVEDGNDYARRIAVQALAQSWHDDPETLHIIKKLAVEDVEHDVRTAAVEALVQGWHDDPETLLIVKKLAVDDENDYTRRIAMQALAQGWSDDLEALHIIKKRGVEDVEHAARRAAVQALAQGWPDDPETLSWLKKLAVEDEYFGVRKAAVQALAQGWSDDPETLPIIKKLATEDEYFDVRWAAGEVLARGWSDDPETSSIIKKQAVEAGDNYGRRMTVETLAWGWHDDPETLSWLKKLAVENSHSDVRTAAIQALAEGWPDDRDILHILEDMAENDENEDVRIIAAEAMLHYGIE